jgi:hypothetical protein
MCTVKKYYIKVKKKRQSNPITDMERARGFREVEAPRVQDNRQMKVVRLSALRTGTSSVCSSGPT